MAKHRPAPDLPPCYAMVQPGLEPVAEEEITKDLGGTVRKTGPGFVVFRLPEIDAGVLQLCTVEDVFLLAWGSDKLTYRAEDLDRIRYWTSRDVDWNQLLRIHHATRPKPGGKPTYRLVTQMTGKHGYRRMDAGKALARGLAGKLPASWKPAEENAAVEIWLTIQGATAICGLRLSDKTMRHRTYKVDHLPASLRPTVAGAMVRLAGIYPGLVTLDPMCGAGTILAEVLCALRGARSAERGAQSLVLGGDQELPALRAAEANMRRLGQAFLARWDARRLPLPDASVDRIISNPPFGKQLSDPQAIGPLYRRMMPELDRVLRPGGRAVLLVSDWDTLRKAARDTAFQQERILRVRVLGQQATISVWRKDKA